MKELYEVSEKIGSDGFEIAGVIGVEGENLALVIKASYPLEMVLAPATKALDGLLDKIEELIPGNLEKPFIEKIKAEYKEQLVKLLAEAV